MNNNNSQTSFNVSNASFNLDHQNFGQSHHMSSSSSLLPNSDAVGNYGGASAYMRSGDIGANFISSKLTTNSPSSSPSLNYANQGVAYNLPSAYSNYVASGGGQLTAEQQLLLQAHRPSYSPKPSSAGNGGGGYENRGLTADQGSYNSLLQESNDRATQLGILTRKTMEDHLMKKQFDAQLNKVSNMSLNDEMMLRAVQQQQAHYQQQQQQQLQSMSPSLRQSTRSNNKSNIILTQIQTSREIAKSCRDMTANEKETFY